MIILKQQAYSKYNCCYRVCIEYAFSIFCFFNYMRTHINCCIAAICHKAFISVLCSKYWSIFISRMHCTYDNPYKQHQKKYIPWFSFNKLKQLIFLIIAPCQYHAYKVCYQKFQCQHTHKQNCRLIAWQYIQSIHKCLLSHPHPSYMKEDW